MLLKILSEKKINEYGGITFAYAQLNIKYKNTFDFDKVWEVVNENKNYLNANPRFDETQLKHYTKKFKEKFEHTVITKDIDWEELVIDLLVIMTLRENLPSPNGFSFRF